MNKSILHITIHRWAAKIVVLSAIGLMLLCGSGCMRIGYEFEKEHFMRPSDTLFIGVRRCGEVEAWFDYVGWALLPGELLADIVLMPTEFFKRAYYAVDPPLNEYLHRKDLAGLERKLQNGVDPNVISTRGYPLLPIIYAKELEYNLDALKILVKYGAKITPEFFNSFAPNRLEMFQYVFDNGLADGIDFKTDTKGIVINWIRYFNYDCPIQEDLDALSAGIALLLEHGASPNDYVEEHNRMLAALDYLRNPDLTKCDLLALVGILKSYGAMTYEELLKANPELPHLEIRGLVHPMFKQVVESLDKPCYFNNTVLSTKYEGLDCPVLVIDGLPDENNGSKEQQDIRKNVIVHRRESPSAWCQEGEVFDVPSRYRIVLTPPGMKVPSRLKDGLPKKCIIHEAWLSLPEFEVYVERPYNRNNGDLPGVYLGFLEFSREMIKTVERQLESWPRVYHVEDNIIANIQKSLGITMEPSSWQANWLKKADGLLRQHGMNGHWLPVKDNKEGIGFDYCFFSSRRTFEEFPKDGFEFVPYPDEVIIHVWWWFNPPELHDYHKIVANGKNGDAYWNYHEHSVQGKRNRYNIRILYGDDVSEETVTEIWELLRTVL